MEPSYSLSPRTLLKMDAKFLSLEFFPSATISNVWDCLTNPQEVDCRLLLTSWLTLIPKVKEVTKIPIRTGEEDITIPIGLKMSPKLLPSMPVLLTLHGVL